MADSVETSPSFTSSGRFRILVGVVLLLGIAAAGWWLMTRGRESTDDAQVDAHLTQIASRVGGTVQKVLVDDNQLVEPGTVLVENVFAWPGLGTTLVQSVAQRDYPTVQAIAIVFGTVVLVTNFAVDIALAVIDPPSTILDA